MRQSPNRPYTAAVACLSLTGDPRPPSPEAKRVSKQECIPPTLLGILSSIYGITTTCKVDPTTAVRRDQRTICGHIDLGDRPQQPGEYRWNEEAGRGLEFGA
jgi:hypothetical protein